MVTNRISQDKDRKLTYDSSRSDTSDKGLQDYILEKTRLQEVYVV